MKEGWKSTTLSACIEKIQPSSKIPSSLYQKDGKYPIVSQEKEFISGYWDNAEDLFTHNIPVTIFGDHTTVVKYIDFNFIIGADGVKILLPKSFLHPKYFFYCVSSIKIANHGYARHYRYLKESIISYPTSLSEQQRIVEILDAEFAKIDALKANAEKSLQAAKDLFQSALTYELKPKKNWGTKSLKEIGKTQTGTTPKTSDKHNYGSFMPFIKPADINIDGLGGLNYDNEGLSDQGVAQGRLFDSYSILMVCIGATIGKVGYSLHPISCNQQINVLSPTKDYDYKYLYYYMSSPSFQFKVIKEGESAKATLPIINKTKWENLTITFPESLQEQNAIAIRLDEMNERCKALQENYRNTIALCEDLKQALLHQAFNEKL